MFRFFINAAILDPIRFYSAAKMVVFLFTVNSCFLLASDLIVFLLRVHSFFLPVSDLIIFLILVNIDFTFLGALPPATRYVIYSVDSLMKRFA